MRSTETPTAKVKRSACRAPAAITLGPVAATSTGTFGCVERSHRNLLAAGPPAIPSAEDDRTSPRPSTSTSKSTSSPRR